MSKPGGARINPLSRRPRQQRLVVAVRGAAGTGKSHFAASMADAGLGRLCYFDVERKARLLPGSDGSKFDALEIRHPDELPEFIDWALDGEGREQGYGCYVLDSWAMYFGRKHRDTLIAVRERTGDLTAQPNAEELAADQMVLQEVLRRICVDSGACVVIVDQIGAKGKEDREENEIGRVLPLTTSGLEYFVDVMLEASLRLDGLSAVRIFRVVKSNSAAFPIGLELRDPNFAALIARLTDGTVGNTPSLPVHEPAPATAPETLDDGPTLTLVQPDGPTLDDLLAKATELGFSRAQLVIAARHYCGKDDLERLSDTELAELDRRLTAHASRRQETPDTPEEERPEAVTAGRGRRGQG
jgi:hypothetical protein